MDHLIRRIRERKIVQWTVVYLAGAWVFLEALGFVADTFSWPAYVVRSAILLCAVGFLAVLVLAWYHGEKGQQRASGLELTLLAGLLILAGVLVTTLGRVGTEPEEAETTYQAAAPADRPSVAVLPFTVRGSDMGVWREGLVDLLSINLDGPTLRAIDSRTVLARWHERVAGGDDGDLQTALEVARGTGARHAVVGTAVATGSQVRVAASVRELPRGDLLRQVQVDGPADSIISVVDRLSIELLRFLLREGPSEPRADLASVTTSSIEALKAYLEGEQSYRRGRYASADEAYQRAIAADSAFALAYYRLGLTRGWTEAAGTELAAGPLARAESLSANLPAREVGLVRAALAHVTGDAGYIDSAQALTARYPDDPEAWYLLGELYYHDGELRFVGWEETEAAFLRAVELDPRWAPHHIHLVDLAFRYHADSALAAERIARYRELAPESPWNRYYEQLFDLSFGSSAIREATLEQLETGELLNLDRLSDRLTHPRFWESQQQILLIKRRHAPPAEQTEALVNLFYGSLGARGNLRAALGYLDDPLAPPSLGACGLMITETTLRKIPTSRLEEVLARDAIERSIQSAAGDPGERVSLLACGALYARYRGRDADHRELSGRLSQFAAEDTASARLIRNVLWLIDGLGDWLAGGTQEGYEKLKDFPHERGLGVSGQWYGQMLLELDRPDDAIPYLIAQRGDPIAYLYLGKAYEASGRDDEARAAYQYFLAWWADADPALQPLVDEARRALVGIAGRLN